MFRAIVITNPEGCHEAHLETLGEERLPEKEVTVRVEYSTLNYKDALAITGKGPVVRSFPMVPGIDCAGTVVSSRHPDRRPGDRVILNGWGAGETHWGGLSQLAAVQADWLVPLPERLTTRQAMGIGTAGYTAMLAVLRLEKLGLRPDAGEILVTGATGGLGSIAVAVLARRGWRVVASTGKAAETEYLKALGATEVIDRSQFAGPPRPLAKERWAGGIDCVGGTTLAHLCAATRYGGVVAACGLAQSMDFPASVAPFILRGVTLAGIDSVYCPRDQRLLAWRCLAQELDPDLLEGIATRIGLGGVQKAAEDLLAGLIRGRIVVDVNL